MLGAFTVLVQQGRPVPTRPDITEKIWLGRKESKQTKALEQALHYEGWPSKNVKPKHNNNNIDELLSCQPRVTVTLYLVYYC